MDLAYSPRSFGFLSKYRDDFRPPMPMCLVAEDGEYQLRFQDCINKYTLFQRFVPSTCASMQNVTMNLPSTAVATKKFHVVIPIIVRMEPFKNYIRCTPSQGFSRPFSLWSKVSQNEFWLEKALADAPGANIADFEWRRWKRSDVCKKVLLVLDPHFSLEMIFIIAMNVKTIALPNVSGWCFLNKTLLCIDLFVFFGFFIYVYIYNLYIYIYMYMDIWYFLILLTGMRKATRAVHSTMGSAFHSIISRKQNIPAGWCF